MLLFTPGPGKFTRYSSNVQLGSTKKQMCNMKVLTESRKQSMKSWETQSDGGAELLHWARFPGYLLLFSSLAKCYIACFILILFKNKVLPEVLMVLECHLEDQRRSFLYLLRPSTRGLTGFFALYCVHLLSIWNPSDIILVTLKANVVLILLTNRTTQISPKGGDSAGLHKNSRVCLEKCWK